MKNQVSTSDRHSSKITSSHMIKCSRNKILIQQKPHFRYVEMCITYHVFRLENEHSYSISLQAKTLLLKLISPIPPPRDAYYNAHKEYELGSMEVLNEVPFGRVVMGLLVFLKVGIILVLWCL